MNQAPARRALDPLPGRYAVCRLTPDAPLAPAPATGLWSATRTADELSIVCEESAAPAGARVSIGWRALRVRGAIAHDEIGVLASLTAPLAAAGVSVFALSTWDTDVLLVRGEDFDRACAAWSAFFEVGTDPDASPAG